MACPKMPRCPSALAALALSLVLAASSPLAAQESQAALLGPDLERSSIEVRIQEATAASYLDDAQRAELLGMFQSALERSDRAAGWEAQRAEFERLASEAPAQLEAIRQRLDGQQGEPEPPVIGDGMSVTELEQRAAQAEAELSAAQAEQERLAAEKLLRESRRLEAPQAAAEVRTRITVVDAELAAEPPTPSEPAGFDLARGRSLLLRARRLAAQSEQAALDAEIQSYDARRELLSAMRDEIARKVQRAAVAARSWREAAIAAREQEALAVAEEARLASEAAANEHEVLRLLADGNRDLAERRTGPRGLVARIRDASNELTRVRGLLEDVRTRSASVRSKYEAAPNTSAIGLLLVRHRSELPGVRTHRIAQQNRQEQAAGIQLRLIETREELTSLGELDARVEELMQALSADHSREEVDALAPTARARLETRRRLYDDLEGDYGVYVDLLADLDVAEGQLIAVTEAFEEYIDERVLWVRVQPPMHDDPGFLGHVVTGARWLGDPEAWGRVIADAMEASSRRPVRVVLQLLLVVGLVLLRPRLRRRLEAAADGVLRLRTDRMSWTLRSLVDTVLLAAPAPLAAWWAGDLLRAAGRRPGAVELAGSLGGALQVMSGMWLVIELGRRACRHRGLCEAHFRFPVESLTPLRRRLVPFSLVALPALVVEQTVAPMGHEALGRSAAIVGELALVWLLATTLSPARGVAAPILARAPDGLLARTRWLWFLLAVGTPLMLIALVELGYLYTAQQIADRMHDSILLALVVLVANSLVLRALFVARRRLALQQYQRRKAAALEEGKDGDGHEMPEDEIDVAAINEQGRRLVTAMAGVALVAGTWLIWADVLPALRVLDEISLWDRTVDMVERIPGVGGAAEQVVVIPTQVPVTVADGLLSAVWVLLTIVVARNGPGLLEIAVLQHLRMQRAGRYATTTVARYLITVLGVMGAFGALGIGWSEVQWLAAAVSVGLGFGLQEIFANFVSGIILLLERPVRVGDTVTVGDVTGSVTRIHMRATTILTWNETELVVPNKDFITTQLVNWTLSNSMLRVIVKVGVAYGSDTELATRLLHQVARENTDVLNEPVARVVFTSFGDSTLDFELRCYVDSPDMFRHIHHNLNMSIDKAFREHGITIAFPQRDLHLKTSETVFNVRYVGEGPHGAPAGGEPVPEPGPSVG